MASGGCATPVKTTTTTCAGGLCCDVEQRVAACADRTVATARINGAEGACCVVLRERQSGRLVPFCATPAPLAGGRARVFPAGVAVALEPRCEAADALGALGAGVGATAGSSAGGVTAAGSSSTTVAPASAAVFGCTATFRALPAGFEPLQAHNRSATLVMRAGRPGPWRDPKELAPCGGAAFGRLAQTLAGVDAASGATTFAVACTAA